MKRLKFCKAGNHYTLLGICHGQATESPHPAKFDPLQRHAAHRRKIKGLQ